MRKNNVLAQTYLTLMRAVHSSKSKLSALVARAKGGGRVQQFTQTRLQKPAKTESSELKHSTQASLPFYLAAQSPCLSRNTLFSGGYLSPHSTGTQYVWSPRSIIKKVHQPTGIQYIRLPCFNIGTNPTELLVEFRTRLPRAKHQGWLVSPRGPYIWRAAHQPACPGCYRSIRSIENALPLGCVPGCFTLLWGANLGDCSWYAKLGRLELTSAPPTQNRLLTFTSPIYAYTIKRKSHLPIPMSSQYLFDQVRHSRLCQ